MFYMLNKPAASDDMEELRRDMPFTPSGDNLPFNRMEGPYSIMLESNHPKSEDSALIFSIFMPDYSLYTVLNHEEASSIIRSRELHKHNYYELVYVLHGEMYQIIEAERHVYPKGSCCLLNLSIRHAEEFSTDFCAVYLSIPLDFFRDITTLNKISYFKIEKNQKSSIIRDFYMQYKDSENIARKAYIDFIPREPNGQLQNRILRIFDLICKITLSPELGSSSIIRYLFIHLFSLLENEENYQTTPIQIGTDTEGRIFEQISKIMGMTNGHASRGLLENELNYSGDYLNKIVHKYTGMNIFNYGMIYCMKEAASMLTTSDLKVAGIAEKLGFKNRTHFYKIFEEIYGLTPKEYRDLNK